MLHRELRRAEGRFAMKARLRGSNRNLGTAHKTSHVDLVIAHALGVVPRVPRCKAYLRIDGEAAMGRRRRLDLHADRVFFEAQCCSYGTQEADDCERDAGL